MKKKRLIKLLALIMGVLSFVSPLSSAVYAMDLENSEIESKSETETESETEFDQVSIDSEDRPSKRRRFNDLEQQRDLVVKVLEYAVENKMSVYTAVQKLTEEKKLDVTYGPIRKYIKKLEDDLGKDNIKDQDKKDKYKKLLGKYKKISNYHHIKP